MLVFYAVLSVLFPALIQGDSPCDLREVKHGTICVCNSTYCDTVPPIENLSSGEFQLYTTTKTNLGFSSTTGTFSSTSASASVKITVKDVSSTHQTIVGFGGAFTDSFGINVLTLPEAAQDNLLYSYFGENGLQYNLGRVPIGGTDFSTKPYTYCDEEDLTLDKFALQPEDFNYKIPFILKAKSLRGDNTFRLFASAWSSPAWTKSSHSVTGSGELKGEYYDWWAQYYIKFFDAYNTNNVTFWGVTAQNEAFDGHLSLDIPNLKFSANQMNKWIKDHLGPVIRNSTYSDLKIIIHDDNRGELLYLNWFVLSDKHTLSYIDGVGLHWYTDFISPPSLIHLAKSDKKDLFVLATEACNGYIRFFDILVAVELGSWSRGIRYLNNILDDLEYDVVGWTDWNMALDESGGPTYIKNYVDAPIIVNATAGEFYKQPMFYVMGHFSKFIVADSVRVNSAVSNDKIRAIVFKRPDEKIVVTISNNSKNDLDVEIEIEGVTGVVSIPSYSVNTLLYKA